MTQSTIDLSHHPLCDWTGPHGLPDFSRIDERSFEPVLDAALAVHLTEMDVIAANEQEPTIDNTLRALELSGRPLSRVLAVFWLRAGAHTNAVIQAQERTISPKIARHMSAIYQNEALFRRIDSLYTRRERLGLDTETERVLEKIWKRFVWAGARLPEGARERLAQINEELASLGTRFGQNVLADEAKWSLLLSREDLAGLPTALVNAMAAAAEARGAPGQFAVTTSRSIMEPFLTFSERRDLRKEAFMGFTQRGASGAETHNGAVAHRTLALRAEKARLLGYPSFAAFKLDDTMAKSPEAVRDLLESVWDKACAKARKDEADLNRLAAGEGANHAVAAWDWRFYAERLRARRYAFNEADLKPYLQLERMVAACFDVAGRLFGLRFEERPDVVAWHPEVRAFEVIDADGTVRATFLADYFARPSKRSGAWMSALERGHRLDEPVRPVVYNIMNFAKPAAGEPALLSLDDARTLFHEFGHALHGILSEATWPSVSGTSVARDFVELPSQLFEHWLTVPEVLEKHALHHSTGAPMPRELLDKLIAARSFNAGFAAVEFTASALVDMACHARADAPQDPIAFEADVLARIAMPAAIAMRHRLPHFLHIFSGDGYSAGYYSYLWSEVLDADAFAAFEEAGDPFDPDLAARLRQYIYASGGTADPEHLYTAFRGRMPSPDAMLAKRGLIAPAALSRTVDPPVPV